MATDEYLIELLRKECKKAGGQRKWGDLHDISEAHISDMLRGKRNMFPHVAQKLGYRPKRREWEKITTRQK